MKQSLLFLAILLTEASFVLQAQAPRDFRKEAMRLIKTLDENHYQPPVLDDSFSNEILESVLSQLDPGHLYFDEKDVQSLEQFRNRLDDEWKGDHWDFLKMLTETYRSALNRGGIYLAKEIEQDISWEKAEVYFPEGDAKWCKTEPEQRNRWKLWIKYKALAQIKDLPVDSARTSKDINFVLTHEKETKQRILAVEERRTKRILHNPNGFENYVASVYFHAVAAYFDPHSLYLSPREFDNFKSAISTKEYSFGIGLNEDRNGNIHIEYLIPGGPAWKSGELHQGDMLIELQWEGQSTFDLVGIGLDEFLELLDRGNPSSARFTFRQSNGLRKSVSLQKEKIENEENTVKGFLLTGTKKIGYISLPGFYTQWGSDEISSCANDVAAEIIKLKGESIEGLILDIRSNGGGSLKEAIEMTGIFIDEGPMAVIREKSGKTETIKDLYRGTVYDGPLTILIDGQSASASEILAAALQDYHRGIIVGGASFGKATGQAIFSLNADNQNAGTLSGSKEGFGFATVTQIRIYRVTGKSNQSIGVIPDISLPDLYAAPAFHEMGLPRAFARDSLTKSTLFSALPVLPLAALKKNSFARVHDLTTFKKIEWFNSRLAERRKESRESIVLQWQNNSGEVLSEEDQIIKNEPSAQYEVRSPEFNRIRIQADPYLKEFTQLWIRNLKEDPYVEEAFRITSDYIQLKIEK